MNTIFEKIYAINLDQDKEKLDRLTQHLGERNIYFERFSGVHGQKFLEQASPELVQKTVGKLCANFCTPATIGIFLSHRAIWEKMVQEKVGAALILEDDVEFSQEANQKLCQAWREVPEDWDLVYLGCFGACAPQVKDYNMLDYVYSYLGNIPNAGARISPHVFVPENPHGLHAYALSQKGAQKLLRQFQKAKFHVDIAIACASKGMKIYALHPNLAFQRIEQETNTSSERPYFLNSLCRRVSLDRQGLPLSWTMSVVGAQVAGYPLNLWTAVWAGLALLAKVMKSQRLMQGILILLLSDLLYILENRDWQKLWELLGDLLLVGLIFQLPVDGII